MDTSGVQEVSEINDRVRFVQIAVGEHGVVHALDEGGDVWRFTLAKKLDKDGETLIHAWHRMEQARVVSMKTDPSRPLGMGRNVTLPHASDDIIETTGEQT